MNDRIIDINEGLGQVGGNRTIYKQLLDMMQDNLDAAMDNIRISIAEGDYSAAASEAHRIKGIAGNLGAAPLMESMRQLELELKADINKYTIMLGELSSIRDDVILEVSEFIP